MTTSAPAADRPRASPNGGGLPVPPMGVTIVPPNGVANPTVVTPTVSSVPHEPSDEGVRLERLKTIAALRDSGALTDTEFETEKRRILDGRQWPRATHSS